MTAVPSPSAQHPALRQLLPSTVHAHPLRVTSQQTMSTSIAFALNHLRQPDSYPLVLHCLPSTSSSTPSSTSDPASLSNKTAETSVAALPKLVSLSEVIQREWFSVPLPSSSSSSQPSTSQLAPPSPSLRAPEDQSAIAQAARTKGLHQYTLLTTLEEIKLADPTRKSSKDAEEDEIARQEEELVVMGWLTGKAGREKRPRKKHTPTMLVVLATASIPELVGSRNWTYVPFLLFLLPPIMLNPSVADSFA
ncbi:hypothetical protein JCM11641_003955 [Rhodosporidiobolus odoratus]